MRNKTNVKYSNIRYEQKGKVTKCFLTYEIETNRWPIMGYRVDASLLMKVANKLNFSSHTVNMDTFYPTSFKFDVEATATCDTTKDAYDSDRGKRIALTRAQAKAFEKTCKFYDLLQIELDKSYNEITRIIDNNWHAANKCWDHAKKLENMPLIGDKK